jgi:hypothetical protein
VVRHETHLSTRTPRKCQFGGPRRPSGDEGRRAQHTGAHSADSPRQPAIEILGLLHAERNFQPCSGETPLDGRQRKRLLLEKHNVWSHPAEHLDWIDAIDVPLRPTREQYWQRGQTRL